VKGPSRYSAARHNARHAAFEQALARQAEDRKLAAQGTLRALGLGAVRISASDLKHDSALRATLRQMQSDHIRTLVPNRERVEAQLAREAARAAPRLAHCGCAEGTILCPH
jgi:hypothetical protein